MQGAIWTLLRLDNGQRGTPTRFMGKEEGNRVLHAPVLRCGDERNLFQKAHQEGTLRLIKPQKKGKMIIAGHRSMRLTPREDRVCVGTQQRFDRCHAVFPRAIPLIGQHGLAQQRNQRIRVVRVVGLIAL